MKENNQKELEKYFKMVEKEYGIREGDCVWRYDNRYDKYYGNYYLEKVTKKNIRNIYEYFNKDQSSRLATDFWDDEKQTTITVWLVYGPLPLEELKKHSN